MQDRKQWRGGCRGQGSEETFVQLELCEQGEHLPLQPGLLASKLDAARVHGVGAEVEGGGSCNNPG